MQDLAQAIGGGHHHHHFHAASSDTDTDISSGAGQISQLLAEFQSNSTQNEATNPMAIIMNTLSSAGVGS
jgi:hypothetical protein